MKLLLISLSVVFFFSCSKDTPTLDTSLHTEKLVYNVKGKEDLIISIKWRFISYSKVDELGRVKVKGGFIIDFVNKTTPNVSAGMNKFIFYDKEDFKIAECYYIEMIEVAAKSSNSHSGNFEILLDNADLTNDIERLELKIFVNREVYF